MLLTLMGEGHAFFYCVTLAGVTSYYEIISRESAGDGKTIWHSTAPCQAMSSIFA